MSKADDEDRNQANWWEGAPEPTWSCFGCGCSGGKGESCNCNCPCNPNGW
jgi:hypothetical protein